MVLHLLLDRLFCFTGLSVRVVIPHLLNYEVMQYILVSGGACPPLIVLPLQCFPSLFLFSQLFLHMNFSFSFSSFRKKAYQFIFFYNLKPLSRISFHFFPWNYVCLYLGKLIFPSFLPSSLLSCLLSSFLVCLCSFCLLPCKYGGRQARQITISSASSKSVLSA